MERCLCLDDDFHLSGKRCPSLSPLTLEKDDNDDPPNLGISQVPKAGSDGVKPSVGEPMQCMGDPLCMPPFAALLLRGLKETLLILL